MVAFGPLRGVFNGRELRRLADAMAERGLRLHQGLEEVLDGWDVERAEKAEEKTELWESENEIEEDAKELRRLMPH